MRSQKETIQIFMKYCGEFAKNFIASGDGDEPAKEEEYAETISSWGYGVHIQDENYVLHPATETEEKFVEAFIGLYLYEIETEKIIFAARITTKISKKKQEFSTEFSEADRIFLKELHILEENNDKN